MTIRYKNTFRDIMAFCFYHYPRSPMVIVTYAIGFAFLSLMIAQTLPQTRSFLVKLITFLIMELIAFIFIAGIFSVSVVLSMISRRNKTLFADRTVTLTEDFIAQESVFTTSESKWSVVQKLARIRRYIFIYVSQHASYVIPRRAFRDDAEWDSFYEFCKRKTGSA
jgi:YcxB-like protein